MNDEQYQNEIVTIGNDRTQISFHELQSIYNALTGKQEQLSSKIGPGYLINFGDLDQLNERISQALKSYGARIGNCSVVIAHVNGQREVFSSFHRFRLYNKTQSSPTLSLVINYSFLIIPAGSEEVLQYKLQIDLPSALLQNSDCGQFTA